MMAELGPQSWPQLELIMDMDVLPVEERTGLSYASLWQRGMPACGHDLRSFQMWILLISGSFDAIE